MGARPRERLLEALLSHAVELFGSRGVAEVSEWVNGEGKRGLWYSLGYMDGPHAAIVGQGASIKDALAEARHYKAPRLPKRKPIVRRKKPRK